jgi:hypothetical protein
MKTVLSYFFLFIFIFCSVLIYPQCSTSQTYPKGGVESLNTERLIKLRNILNVLETGTSCEWVILRKLYWGDLYEPGIPDIIFYIRKGMPVKLI